MRTRKRRIDWQYHIQQQYDSGLPVKVYCKREGFSCWSFYTNRKRLQGAISLKKTLKIRPITKASCAADNLFINLGSLQCPLATVRFPDTTVLEFSNSLTPEQLSVIIDVLKTNSYKGVTPC